MAKIIASCGTEVLVDDDDFPLLSRYTWSISGGYAVTNIFVSGKYRCLSMHRMIMGIRKFTVDHANRNRLDNRKANLRFCNASQNCANSSRKPGRTLFRGVQMENKKCPTYRPLYRARITIDGVRVVLGYFNCPIEAAKAYDTAAIKHLGEFAVLNFPDGKLVEREGEG